MEKQDQANMLLEAQPTTATSTINQTQLPEWKQETNRLRSEFNRLKNSIDDKLEKFRVQIVGHFKLLLKNAFDKSIDFSIEPRVNPSKGLLGPAPVTKIEELGLVVVNETKEATMILETNGEPREASKVDTLVVEDVYDFNTFDKRSVRKEINNTEWPNSVEREQALLLIQAPISAVLDVSDEIQRVVAISKRVDILRMKKDIVGLRQLSDSSFRLNMDPSLLCFRLSNPSNRNSLIQLAFMEIYSIRFMKVDRDSEFHDPYSFKIFLMSILQGAKNLSVNKESIVANLLCWPTCIVSTVKEVIVGTGCEILRVVDKYEDIDCKDTFGILIIDILELKNCYLFIDFKYEYFKFTIGALEIVRVKLGISQLRFLKGLISLVTAIILSWMVDMLTVTIKDAIERCSWLDSVLVFLRSFAVQDAFKILSFCLSFQLENLLLMDDGVLKISEFNLSVLPQQIGDEGLRHPTNYISPEVKNNGRCYGVIMFVLTGDWQPSEHHNVMSYMFQNGTYCCKKLVEIVKNMKEFVKLFEVVMENEFKPWENEKKFGLKTETMWSEFCQRKWFLMAYIQAIHQNVNELKAKPLRITKKFTASTTFSASCFSIAFSVHLKFLWAETVCDDSYALECSLGMVIDIISALRKRALVNVWSNHLKKKRMIQLYSRMVVLKI